MKLNHILFIGGETPICEAPERLGSEFVKFYFNSKEPACYRCDDAIVSYNEAARND
jgi:hypothetical protein